ncbi:20370_t:CDS:2 [Gigaspora rosea]|nr:20370_t:CDS:2 [Gigaspora rosea]
MPVSTTCPNEKHNCTGLTPCCGPTGFCGSQSIDCGVGCYPQFSEVATFEVISDTKAR